MKSLNILRKFSLSNEEKQKGKRRKNKIKEKFQRFIFFSVEALDFSVVQCGFNIRDTRMEEILSQERQFIIAIQATDD